MTEIELLRNLRDLETQSRILKVKIKLWKDETGKLELIKRNDEINKEVEIVKRQLEILNDKKYSEEIKSAIIRQLEKYIAEIHGAGNESKSSDNQEITVENALLEKIYRNLYSFVPTKGSGASALVFFNEKALKDHPLYVNEVTDFLNHELQIVTDIKEPSYFKLRRYFTELKDRIIKRFNG